MESDGVNSPSLKTMTSTNFVCEIRKCPICGNMMQYVDPYITECVFCSHMVIDTPANCQSPMTIEFKETNQLDERDADDQTLKTDAGKPLLTLVPTQIIFAIARVLEFGMRSKYKRDSWRKVDIQRYRDALYRHWLAYLQDPQGVDEESDLPHLWHLACNVAFLCELEQIERENG